jgi:streptogramin lyase
MFLLSSPIGAFGQRRFYRPAVEVLEERCLLATGLAEFAIPTSGSGPQGITAGPDGNLWFAENATNQIGRITPTGTITEFPITTSGSDPAGIVAGPDGNLWFTEFFGNKIGQITPTGTLKEFSIPTTNANAQGITAGPDGNLWFTETQGNKIGQITPAGTIHEFTLAANSGPVGITTGPNSNLWFVESGANKIGRITPAGVITEFAIPTAASNPQAIARGSDGNLWFTEHDTGKIGRVNTAGTISGEFSIPTSGSAPQGITNGPDGNLWFAELSGNKIARITVAGVFTEAPTLASGSGPFGITTGPDGNLWFTERDGNRIGRQSPNLTVPGTNETFVTALYRDLLQRTPDSQGFDYFTGILNHNVVTPNQVALAIVGSIEHRTVEMQTIYQQFLGRAPTTLELNNGIGLLAGGTPLIRLEATLMNTAEYLTRAGGTTQGFLTAVYRDVLGRAVDPSGQSAFTPFLDAGVSHAVFALNILQSEEGIQHATDDLYSLFLRRTPDPGGNTTVTTALRAGILIEVVMSVIAGSDEYFKQSGGF